jgi:hypothetical protein
MFLRHRMLAIALAAHCTAATAEPQTLTLKSSSGQILHTIPLVDGSPLEIGDMNTATQLRLVLQGPQGQAAHTAILATGQPMSILPNGNIEAVCATSSAPDACDGLPSTQAANLSTFGVSAPIPTGGVRPRVNVGALFRIEWASTSADVCVSDAPPQLMNWAGQAQRAASGVVANARFTALPNPNPALLTIRCYGGAGASTTRTILIDVVQS